MRSVSPIIAVLMLIAIAAPADATISRVYFNGQGVVTYRHDGVSFGGNVLLQANPVTIGQGVYVAGLIELATANGGQTVADNFTGRVALTDYDLRHGLSTYQFNVANGGAAGSNRTVLPVAQLDFVNGVLTGLNLNSDDDGSGNFLTTSTFGFFAGTAGNGGTWQLTNVQSAAIPEPTTWLMMLTGFTALALRQRRARAHIRRA